MKTIIRAAAALTLIIHSLCWAGTTLRVSSSYLTPESTLEVIFDRAVVADSQIGKTSPSELVTVSPATAMTATWKSANVATLKFTAPLALSTVYTFSVPGGKTYLNGNPIPQGNIKQIASLPLQVQGTSSRSSSVLHNRQPKHYIYFNDAIDPQAAAPSFVYQNANGVQVAASVRRATKSDSTAKYYRPLTWAQRNQVATTGKEIHHPEAGNTPIPTAVVVSPISPLPIGNKWYLYIKKGLANTSKNAALSTQRHIWIGNIAPFKVQNIYARLDVNQPRQINVVFNSYIPKKLTQEQFAQWISVTPMPKHARYQALGKTVIIKGNFDDTDTWNVRVKPDITSTSGLTLTESFDKKITFESLPTGLALPSYNTGQYAKGHRLYEIDTVNLASVRIRVKQISSDGIARAAQGYRHYSGNGHNYNAISPEHPVPYTLISGKTIYDRTVFLDNKIDTSRSITIDWNEVLGNRQGTGTLFVSVEGEAKNKSNGDRRVAQSLVQLTDIGLCWKLTSKQALIYAFSCNTGKPLANVQLEVFNEDAQLATTVQTDANGLAKVPRTEQSRHLLAKHGNDRYIVPFDRTLSTVSLWRFPVQIDWNHLSGWKRNAMMFTDRNLYRPGETVQLKGIVRRFQDNQVELPADGTAQLIIRDSASRVLVDEEVTLSKNGTFDHTLDLPAETVGSFEVELTLPEDPAHEEADSWVRENYRIFHHRFHVQEFRRNAFEITSNILPAQPGDPAVKLNLSAGYYQGQPVKDAKVQWYFTAKQTGFYPKKYRDFLFGDHREYDPWYWSHYFGYSEDTPHRSGKDREGEAKLDRNGKGELSFDLPKQTFPSTLQVNLHSEVTDSRNQTLTSRTRATVHPADTYIGISRVDRLVRVGEDSKLELIAVDSKGEKLTSSAEVKVLIEREYYEAVKVKHTNGRVRVKNTKKTAKISESTITIEPDKPTTLPFIPTESGRHVITLSGKDAKGHAFATASKIWIYGSKEYPWAVEDGSKIKIVPEKKRYLPGDTARLLVMTPIEGTALVTVERAGVHREYRRELKADNPVIELPLTDMDAPNAFVSIIVIRGASASPRKHKEPALKLGYCTLNVANVKDRLDVALKVETSQNRPGESTTISGIVRTADGKPAAGSEVVLYAEDEGTLAVAGYKNPKPMGHFHAPRPLLVRSGTSFSTFIAENPDDRMFANKGFAIGGGDGSDGGNLRPKPRSDFNPCAVWQPAIKTDENGAFQVEFINPDTLTRYRVVAVALHGASKFGSANTHYTVNKPLMLEPTPPRYASEGDQLLPKVLVQNNSEFEGSWKIGLKTSGVSEITSGTPTFKTISLKPGDQAAVTFDVQFTNTGTAHWTWSAEPISIKGENSLNASMKRDLGDLAENTFEVTYPVPKLRQVEFISMRKDNQRDFLRNLDPELLGGRGHLDLDLSNSLLLEAGGAVDFLLHYPYGCVEQTTSSLMPWFAVRDLKKIVPGFRKKKEADISSAIQQGADRLLTMQTKDGGLAYWPGGRDPEIWASAYGGMGLILAKRHGARVPQHAIDELTKWITKSLTSGSADTGYRNSWHAETRARALYILALAKHPQVAMQNKMLDDAAKLSPTATCYLALAIHHSGGDRSTAVSLLNNMNKRVIDPNSWMRYHADDAMNVLAWSQIDPSNEAVDHSMQKMLTTRNERGHWRTTWCNSWSLQAMASYARYVEKGRKATSLQLITNGVSKTITLDANSPTQHVRIPLEKDMKLIVNTEGPLYARVNVSAKPALAPQGPRGKNGLSIVRRYQRVLADGTLEDMVDPRVGDLIKVNLEVTLPYSLQYLVIEDRLPATFETVNEAFKSQSSRHTSHATKSWSVSHKELRSDRASFFLNRSWRSGSQTISYLARITSAGKVIAPAAKVEAMYDPQQVALTGSNNLTVMPAE